MLPSGESCRQFFFSLLVGQCQQLFPAPNLFFGLFLYSRNFLVVLLEETIHQFSFWEEQQPVKTFEIWFWSCSSNLGRWTGMFGLGCWSFYQTIPRSVNWKYLAKKWRLRRIKNIKSNMNNYKMRNSKINKKRIIIKSVFKILWKNYKRKNKKVNF